MKRPVLKRVVKTVEIISWTLEYEDIPDLPVDETTAVVDNPPPPAPPSPAEPTPPASPAIP